LKIVKGEIMSEKIYKRLRVPLDRLGVVIGKGGEIKKRIENTLNVKLKISSSGVITIEANPDNADNVLKAELIIKAIGLGFSPEKAFLLLKEDYNLRIIDLSRYARNKKDLIRIKGRIIGEKGKARRIIEETTDTKISVSDKEVAIIGRWSDIMLAEEAIMKLIRGARHATVYDWLYEQRRIQKFLEMEEKLKGGEESFFS